MNQAERLLRLAQELVVDHPGFFEVKGPGAGDRATNAFMKNLRERARGVFGNDYAEKVISGANDFRVDYYFPSEATIVEVALGLSKPKTEFERDILKATMAQEADYAVKRLVFISKPGALKKCAQPGRVAMTQWLLQNHHIAIEIYELHANATYPEAS